MFIQLFKNVYFLIIFNDHWRAIEVSVKSGHEGSPDTLKKSHVNAKNA